jgi:hypothetical protein
MLLEPEPLGLDAGQPVDFVLHMYLQVRSRTLIIRTTTQRSCRRRASPD